MKKAERLLQLLIVLFCFVYLSVSFTSPASHAQVACNDQPPIRDNNHPEPYFQLKANMWLAGSQVAVTIYDSHETQSTQIEQGVNDWNSKTDCSAVHFTTAIDSSTDPPSSDPTSGKMWVVRASNSQAFPFTNTSNQMIAARINIQTPYTNTTPGALRGLARHETGHTFGLLNTTAAADSVMHDNRAISDCDVQAIRKVYCPATPTPSPSPTPDPVECNPGQAAYCWDIFCTGLDPNDCNDCDWNPPPGECGSPQAGCNCSPILIDVDGNGFSLSNAANGVEFDLNGDGEFQARLGWTAPGSDDAWLVLDRNTNGAVDSGQELFGNFTPQPPGAEQHGFLALQTFDHLANGGNNDGRIDSQDAIYSSLRLWRDFNRDGISQTPELSPLAQLEVESIDLDFHQSKKRDDHGNWFKYRSMIRDANGIHVGKWAWDVYLVHEPLNGQVSLVPDYSIFEFSGPSCATSTTNNLNQEVIPSSGV